MTGDAGAEQIDLGPYTQAGLYDPDSPDADQRAELLAFLASVGCTIDEMLFADAEGRLFGLAGDRLLRPGRNTYTWSEVAERVGISTEALMRAVRAYGLPDVGLDIPVASDQDVDLLSSYAIFVSLQGEADALSIARVIGGSVAKIAEAISQLVRGSNDALRLETAVSPTETAMVWAAMAGLVPQIGAQLDVLFRHQLISARRHFEASDSSDIAGMRQMRLCVGFVDLTGFTSLSSRLSPSELGHLLSMFESQTSEVIDHYGGRVVKFIGDEVMFVAPTAQQAATIAAVIVAGAPDDLPARVGLAYGACLATDGDYFGEPVNLAARLVDRAQPRQILVPTDFLMTFTPTEEWSVEEVDAFDLRGFSEPVPAVLLTRAPVSVESPLT